MAQVKITIGKLINQYVSKNGTPTFVYLVEGSPESIAAYKESKGSYHRENDEGATLHFATSVLEEGTEMVQNSKGGFSVQTDLVATAKAADAAKEAYKTKLEATQAYLGISKEEMQKLMLAQLMA